MRVFISGSRFPYETGTANNKNQNLSPSVIDYIDRLIADNAEILIGDCYGIDQLVQEYLRAKRYNNVTIYVSGKDRTTRHNESKWPEKHFKAHGNTPYSFRIEKDFRMAEDADSGLTVWNGESLGTFANMLYLVAQGKTVYLYLMFEDKWININTVEDLLPYVGTEGVIGKTEIREVMERCGFSDEMVSFHVSENSISPYDLADTICRAPVSLDEKMRLLGVLERCRNIKYDVFDSVCKNIARGKSSKTIKHDIRAIIDNRAPESIWVYLWELYTEISQASQRIFELSEDLMYGRSLYLFSEWYDTDELCHKNSPCGLFATYETAKQYIENEEKENKTGEGYYRLELWDTYDPNHNKERFEYYYYKGQICWFQKMTPRDQTNGNKYYFPESNKFTAGDFDLNIKTPYKPGDVVLIDCRPFGPAFHAIILEAKNQGDCCFPTIIFNVPGTCSWRITALKHRHFYFDIRFESYTEPMLSPLYRIKKVSLPDDDFDMNEYDTNPSIAMLFVLRDIIDGNEEKAAQVWKHWDKHNFDDLNDEEMLDLFNFDEYDDYDD